MRLVDCPDHAKQAWESVNSRQKVGFEVFMAIFADFECVPVDVDGEPVGAVLIKGPEVHACINKGYGRWATKKLWREFERIIEKHGKATTAIVKGNQVGAKFVERLGFHKTGETDNVVYYEANHGC